MKSKSLQMLANFTRLLTVCLFCLVALLVGCSSEPSLADFNNTNLKKLRGAYGMYLVAHQLEGPKNEVEFKAYLKSDKGAITKLKRMGLTPEQVDDIFVSERDGQPFKIRYGLSGLGDHPIVFEAEGVDGKRFVAFSTPREVAADEYEQLWSREIKPDAGQEDMNRAAEGK